MKPWGFLGDFKLAGSFRSEELVLATPELQKELKIEIEMRRKFEIYFGCVVDE